MLSYVVPIDVYRLVDLLHHFHLPGDEPDGFVKVFVDDTFKYSTRCINNDRNPKWQDRRRVVDIVADRSIIRLHVYDSDSSDNSTLIDPIGFVEFCIGDIQFDHAAWLHCQYIMCFTNMFSGYKDPRLLAKQISTKGTYDTLQSFVSGSVLSIFCVLSPWVMTTHCEEHAKTFTWF